MSKRLTFRFTAVACRPSFVFGIEEKQKKYDRATNQSEEMTPTRSTCAAVL